MTGWSNTCTFIQQFTDSYNIQVRLVLPQLSVAFPLGTPWGLNWSMREIIPCSLKDYQNTYFAKTLVETHVCNSVLGLPIQGKFTLLSPHQQGVVTPETKEKQIFEVGGIWAEIFKVSGRSFCYESILFEDPWWQELFQNCCNFEEKR